MPSVYRGRFAPSPTGPLHLGSLLAALVSFLQARRQGGQWLVRIEDLDTHRTTAGASTRILKTLEAFALHWDEAVLYQSQRQEAYEAGLAHLRQRGWLYPCVCSRRTLRTVSRYPGTCRERPASRQNPHALRVRTDDTTISWQDSIQGHVSLSLTESGGDFIVRRRDTLVAYQLAVVIDDAAQGITEVVRGIDLLDSTPKQIFLQRGLGVTTPQYAHIPVITDATGHKLSKQTHAPAVETSRTSQTVFELLKQLNQAPPPDLRNAPVDELLAWAIQHWRPEQIPRSHSLPLPSSDRLPG